ncbi:DsbA family protein [Paractinoplanes lichenicola]|uniref:DsbA family protein n=1 Tax=Paractinoplanes lichenicola TaxID=2802976 RepID=A0ABS1VKY8_9ACTN|nr:DsbA family protein [Actinoplanes lichenicola]MBL7255392.1 DsbA family protein [Actinoplanes lichenicola]
MEATFFFDPACPFTWTTSRWLVSVAPSRDLTIRWRAMSLLVLNGDNIPDRHRPRVTASFRALRLVEALRADQRDDTIAAFYAAIGTRVHDDGATLDDTLVEQAAEAAGVDGAKTILDDASWETAVRESHELALKLAGPGIGSPVLHLDGAPRGLHGPIIGDVPPENDSLALFDSVSTLMRIETFSEVKRGR